MGEPLAPALARQGQVGRCLDAGSAAAARLAAALGAALIQARLAAALGAALIQAQPEQGELTKGVLDRRC